MFPSIFFHQSANRVSGLTPYLSGVGFGQRGFSASVSGVIRVSEKFRWPDDFSVPLDLLLMASENHIIHHFISFQ